MDRKINILKSDLGFYLKGQMYPNNSMVTITDIGVGDNSLFCLSNSSSCCRSRDGMVSGQWFLPEGSNPIDGNGDTSNADFSRSRKSSAVLLNRRNNAIGPEGLYRCDVIDKQNTLQSLCVGVTQSKFNKYLEIYFYDELYFRS